MKEPEQSSSPEQVAVVAKREWHARVAEEVDYTTTEAFGNGIGATDGVIYTF